MSNWAVTKDDEYHFDATQPAEAATEKNVSVAMTAMVKWDGCVHLRTYYNGSQPGDPKPDSDYIHICDIDRFIRQLLELRRIAKKKWEEWP